MQTRVFKREELEEIGTRIFDAGGSPHEESKLVSEVLVRSSMMGHDSHGVVRFIEYSRWIQSKAIVPGAPFEVVQEVPSLAVVNGNYGWGPLVASKAMKLAIRKARESGVGTVVIRNGMHIGRLGEYSVMPAAEGMIGSIFVNSYGGIDRMAPWGGIEPRLSPNPLSWAIPTGLEWPLLVDITTSVMPEGKVRVALHSGKQLPEGVLIDSDGKPTTNPADLYERRGGAILPFGGIVGHKGYGLNLVAEVLAGALSGVGCRGDESAKNGNGVFLQAMDVARFVPLKQFTENVQRFITHIKSSRPLPGVEEVLIPGEIEYRAFKRSSEEGVRVDEGIWNEIVMTASGVGVSLSPRLGLEKTE